MSHPTNFEAGNVPYPSDPAEVYLAKRSTEVIWRAFPYFGMRYGERGRRFGSSDNGYLVVAASLPLGVFLDQVEWLATVLARKGMPSWLLECQLQVLSAIGNRRRWSGSEAAAEAARLLRDKRREAIGDDLFAELQEAGPARRARGTGKMIASAVADVENKLVGSTDPFLGWLAQQGVDRAAVEQVVGLVSDAAPPA